MKISNKLKNRIQKLIQYFTLYIATVVIISSSCCLAQTTDAVTTIVVTGSEANATIDSKTPNITQSTTDTTPQNGSFTAGTTVRDNSTASITSSDGNSTTSVSPVGNSTVSTTSTVGDNSTASTMSPYNSSTVGSTVGVNSTASTTSSDGNSTTSISPVGNSTVSTTSTVGDNSTASTMSPYNSSTVGSTVGVNSTASTTSSDGNSTTSISPVGNSTEMTSNVTKATPNTGTTREGVTPTGGNINTTSSSNPVTDETGDLTTMANNTTNVTTTQSTEGTTNVSSTTERRTTEPVSTPKVTTKTPEPQSPTPDYPKATFPEVEGSGPVLRQIAIEVAVTNTECEASTDFTGQACKTLEDDFINFANEKYSKVSGYFATNVVDLRLGSVIISHQVFYDYNEMTPDDRQLSAEDIYERTLAPSVDSKESFGSFTFTECTDCADAGDEINICDVEIYSVTCEDGLEAFCQNNLWLCQSKCANTETLYCSEKSAYCRQGPSDTTPTCSCSQSKDGWYIGARCQFYVDRLWLIVGFSVGGGVVLIIILILIICLCQTKKEMKEMRKMPYEKTNEAFLLGNDHLQIDNEAETHEMGDYGNGGYITDDDDTSPKPYSYVYASDVDVNYGRKGSKDVKGHEDNPELDKVLQERAFADKKKHQSFWGNLEHDVIHEAPKTTGQNQMNATNINVSKANGNKQKANGYPQKRPQTAAIPPPDYDVSSGDPFNKRYSQILSDDYGKNKTKY